MALLMDGATRWYEGRHASPVGALCMTLDTRSGKGSRVVWASSMFVSVILMAPVMAKAACLCILANLFMCPFIPLL